MLGINFPISEYYKNHIIDAHTISRAGKWWTALLVISDPRDGRPFIGLYKWQNTDSGWKTRNRFLIKKTRELVSISEGLERFNKYLEAD
jgi:hypothetical protein